MEIKCKKNGHAISFEVPEGENPEEYARKRLRELSGKKRLRNWEFETV